MKLLFLHGFASCGLGFKSKCLKQHFGEQNILAPDLSHIPELALQQANTLIQHHSIDALVGASLGGYYCVALNAKHNIPAILINPATRPWVLLNQHLGRHERWCDRASFEFTSAHGQQLENMFRIPDPGSERYLLLQKQGDEVLDYREAVDFFQPFHVELDAGGNHRFEDLANKIDCIKRFLSPPDHQP